MQDLFEVTALFPTVVARSNLGRSVTEEELKVVKDLEYRENRSNLVSVNTNVLDLPELESIKKFVEHCLTFYTKQIIKSTNVEAYITQSWVNITEEKQNHHKHFHPNSFLSGVFYIDIVPSVDKITFFRKEFIFPLAVDPSEFSILNSDSWTLYPNAGDIFIFPSAIEHEVPTKKEDNKRMSIAFNTFIKGSIGSDHGLTQLQL